MGHLFDSNPENDTKVKSENSDKLLFYLFWVAIICYTANPLQQPDFKLPYYWTVIASKLPQGSGHKTEQFAHCFQKSLHEPYLPNVNPPHLWSQICSFSYIHHGFQGVFKMNRERD